MLMCILVNAEKSSSAELRRNKINKKLVAVYNVCLRLFDLIERSSMKPVTITNFSVLIASSNLKVITTEAY